MKRIINSLVLLLACGSVAYLSGCGPIDANDPAYLAQTEQNSKKNSDYDSIYQAETEPDPDPDMKEPAPKADEEGQAEEPVAEEPAAEEPAAPPAPAAVKVVRLPTRQVLLPSRVERLAPIVTNTEEDRNFEREVQHHKVIHRIQHDITKHLIKNNLKVKNTYFTKIINHPIPSTQVMQTNSVTQTEEVMPTVEETVSAPVAVRSYGYGCNRGFYRGYGLGYGLGYRGYYDGFRRFY